MLQNSKTQIDSRISGSPQPQLVEPLEQGGAGNAQGLGYSPMANLLGREAAQQLLVNGLLGPMAERALFFR
jgi:hypothetical protein